MRVLVAGDGAVANATVDALLENGCGVRLFSPRAQEAARRWPHGVEPWLVRLKEGRTFAFAGLWDRWKGAEAAPIESCALITTSANAVVAPIHGRMPVLLDRSAYEAWLDPQATEADLEGLLRPFPPEAMEAFPVSDRVNSTAPDDADLTRPVAPEPDPGQRRLF